MLPSGTVSFSALRSVSESALCEQYDKTEECCDAPQESMASHPRRMQSDAVQCGTVRVPPQFSRALVSVRERGFWSGVAIKREVAVRDGIS